MTNKTTGYAIPAPPAGIVLGRNTCRCGATFVHNPRARTAQGCPTCERARGDLAVKRLAAAGIVYG